MGAERWQCVACITKELSDSVMSNTLLDLYAQ